MFCIKNLFIHIPSCGFYLIVTVFSKKKYYSYTSNVKINN